MPTAVMNQAAALAETGPADKDWDEPNAETVSALIESADMRSLIGPFHSAEDVIASLMSDDA
ncbi:MAG: hypothetical protein LBR38_06180 [Synergistaceae bacterium]|jgi:hypothetical protein|nr:hypothetical protein [Synergistaceae bacterium]